MIPSAAEGGAQTFFDDWMVEGHGEHLGEGHLLLMGPSQQVGKVVDTWANGFHAEQASTTPFGIEMKASPVLEHHPASPLTFEGHTSCDKIPVLEFPPALADHC